MSKATAVVPVDEKPTAIASAAQLARWNEDAGAGLEEVGAKDIAIPFLGHVQGLSKQLVEQDAKYLPDAKIGSIFNTVTGECFGPSEGIAAVVVDIKKAYAEKQPKQAGGKIVMVYATRAEAQAKGDPSNELLDGYRVFVLYLSKTGTWTPAVMTMCTKSKIYTMRNWNALLTGLRVPGPNGTKIQPPSFAWSYRLTSAMQTFDDGTAAILKIESVGPAPDEAYMQARNLRRALAEGAVKVGTDEETDAAPQQDDDTPF